MPVEPSVVPVCLTKRYTIAVLAATISTTPEAGAITVDKLCAGATTLKLSVTEKFISSLKVVVSFIDSVGINVVAISLLFYCFFYASIIIDVKE